MQNIIIYSLFIAMCTIIIYYSYKLNQRDKEKDYLRQKLSTALKEKVAMLNNYNVMSNSTYGALSDENKEN